MLPWLYTVAGRVVIDAARARRVRPQSTVRDTDVATLAAPGDDLDRTLTAAAVRDSLRALSPDHRAVLVELYYRERSIKETAAVLDIPEGTVKSRAYYALRALRLAAAERGLVA
jgi:RNA polymerase sigma-70 factor (ECF subfamily)